MEIICFVFCFGIGRIDAPTATDSFCDIMQTAVKNELRLTRKEVQALSLKTKIDLATLKEFYRKKCIDTTSDN